MKPPKPPKTVFDRLTLLADIQKALAAGAADEWEAPEFEYARNATRGYLWEFTTWRDLANELDSAIAEQRPAMIGGEEF